MKKVVVFFPYPDTDGTIGQKTYEIKDGELRMYNTDKGDLVVEKQNHVGESTTARLDSVTIAVFKDWIYWEKVE